MDIRNRRALKESARYALDNAIYDPKKLVLIHTGVTIAVSLIATIINFILTKQIENTGGLSGLGMRSVLSTIESVLKLLVLVIMPIWEVGFCFAALNISRGKEAAPKSLLEGFRRFWPLLKAYLLQGFVYLGVAIVSYFLSFQIYLFTPLSNPMFDLVSSLDMTSPEIALTLDDATLLAIMDAYTPMLLIFLAVFLLAVLFVSYRFRMVNYLLLDHPGMGAREALQMSRYQMRGHKASLFKLDLSFLWFYVLQILASVIAYGDALMAYFQIPMGFSAEVAFFLFLILSLAGQEILYWRARNHVDVTYAAFYCATQLPIHQDEEPEQNPWVNP